MKTDSLTDGCKDETPMEPFGLSAQCEVANESIPMPKQDETKTVREYKELQQAMAGLLAETIVTRLDENLELRCVACNCNISLGEKHSLVCPVEIAGKALLKNENML